MKTRKEIIKAQEREIERLKEKLRNLEVVVEKITSAPKNCIEGPWCAACVFQGTIHYDSHISPFGMKPNSIKFCNKYSACCDLVLKEGYKIYPGQTDMADNSIGCIYTTDTTNVITKEYSND